MNIKRTEAFEKLRQKALQKNHIVGKAHQNLEILDIEIQAIFNQITKKKDGKDS